MPRPPCCWPAAPPESRTTPVGPTSVAPTPTTTAGPLFVFNRGGGVGATFGVGSPKAAYDFYRSALPAAGYTITEVSDLGGSDSDASFPKLIKCSGNGYNGRLSFITGRLSDGRSYSDGGTVDIDLSRP